MILPAECAAEAPKKQLPRTKAPCWNRRNKLPAPPSSSISIGAMRFAPPAVEEPKAEKPPAHKREKRKNDPKLVAAARELRDRWLEQVNADPSSLLPQAKYAVNRALSELRSPGSIAALPVAA
jgi:hypothetical protein